MLPDVLDVRMIPIAYGIGYVIGLSIAGIRSWVRATPLREEAAELPLIWGLVVAAAYTVVLISGLLGVA